ncbi:50S ribosomal protein L28 [Kytococcus schroeteri]|uniref:Large ribosomal subunit protein bL28 n=1 Tax=Kytococcus schroeteri TaxID=138300 RepID=A0A2I1P8G8_9MICO|nr:MULTISPECIES: 50S ribosomal protein L28 [Kytococcus]OFS15257.1 50S ribosomal protein L28 [Kytococcus sp. HMSC28H12]PKZ40935.1 50S ribosomal protein L28 [Kytococcus schroeteri]
MSSRCQVTGATVSFGHTISHSHRRSKRRWTPNVQRRRFYVPSLGRTVRLDVSTKGLRTIDKRGIDAVVQDMLARGEVIR